MGARHHPHHALAGLMAQAEVQAKRQPVWRPPVLRTQRRSLWILMASTSIALAAGAALMWDGASDVAPGAVEASETVRPIEPATPTPPQPFASGVPSAEFALPRREEAPRGEPTHPQASEPLPPGIVPDDMPSSP